MLLFKIFKKKQKTIAIDAPKQEETPRLRISHTVYPDEHLPFNDYWRYVYNEVKKDYFKEK